MPLSKSAPEQKPTFYHTLPNGIRIVFRPTPSPVAYAGIMVGAGTRDEEEQLSGMAHYIEHCVFKGTENHSAREIINKIEDIGGEINAYTTKEETTFYAATLANHIERVTALLADLVFHPVFPEKETTKELNVIFDEIETYNDSPSELIFDDFENLIFDPHPLRMPVLGTKKSLRHIRKSDAKAFMQRCYNPEHIVYFCTGNIEWKTVKRVAERHLSEVPYKSRQYTRYAPANMHNNSISYRKHTHQIHVMLGGRAYPLGHEKQLQLYLLQQILGGGSLNSMLNLRLREQNGLVYNIECSYTPLSDCGYWAVYYATEKEHAEQCEELVAATFRSIKDKQLSSSRLNRYKQQLLGQMAIAADNQENAALSMAKQMLYFSSSPLWQQTYSIVAQTTARQLQDVANEILQESNISTLYYR